MSVLEARRLTVRLAGRTLLDDVTVAVRPRLVTGLIGPNGAGKSTLVRALAGLCRPHAGEVLLLGRQLADLPRREVARTLAYLAQGTEVHWPLSVERLVALGRLPHLDAWKAPAPADRVAIDGALSSCGISHLRHRNVVSLSGGERALALLARAMAVQATALLADEPVAGLDPAHQLHVMRLLRQHAAAGRAVVVVLHDLGLAARFCDRVLLLQDGRLVTEGASAEVMTAERLSACYGVEMVMVEVAGVHVPVALEALPPEGSRPAPSWDQSAPVMPRG